MAHAANETVPRSRADPSEADVMSPTAKQRRCWLTGDEARFARLPLAPLIDWIAPTFVRADLAAIRAHRRYNHLTEWAFALPVFATLVVTVQVLFITHSPWVVIFEVLALFFVVLVVWWARHRGYHDRWIGERFLAERLRSMYFLAVCGEHRGRTADDGSVTAVHGPIEEVKRVIDATRACQPVAEVRPDALEAARDYLCELWIDDQLLYYQRRSRRYASADKVLHAISTALFVVAMGAALIHLCSSAKPGHAMSSSQSAVIAVSIAVPVVAAGFHGLRAQREYRRHSDRYQRVADRLVTLRKQMREVEDIAGVRRVARKVERLTRDEHWDWFGAARLEDDLEPSA